MLLATASNFAQYATDSIYYGSFFALISLSLSLLFGVMGLMNFAYGELIMAGAYVMYYTRSWGWLAMIVIIINTTADSVSRWNARSALKLPTSSQCQAVCVMPTSASPALNWAISGQNTM